MTDKKFGRVGLVARFKPVHIGHAALLESICEDAEEVIIGIGSSNKYNPRNPFTVEETKDMIELVVKPKFSNYKIIEVPDFGDGPKWKEYVAQSYGPLDYFVTDNNYVKTLLEKDYRMIEPHRVIPACKHAPICASMVREEMARYGDWKSLVPSAVAEYLGNNGLVERFRKEFGLQILAGLSAPRDYKRHEDFQTEIKNTKQQ
ncbi:MAG: adenylyltransferase/cytidyltransferase family protein [Candidatus Woesearchaeota archaeon]|nr:adenylyltransferase/cytidyltransferase family protein [Candidatus Woesearchaeota archaeon]